MGRDTCERCRVQRAFGRAVLRGPLGGDALHGAMRSFAALCDAAGIAHAGHSVHHRLGSDEPANVPS